MRFMTPNGAVDDKSSGKSLKAAMDAKSVTVAQLSSKTGLSTRTINNLRSGKSAGNGATWIAISRALGMSIDELVK